jgi:Mg2+/citrate symporter
MKTYLIFSIIFFAVLTAYGLYTGKLNALFN